MRFRPLSSRLWTVLLASWLGAAAPTYALEDVLQTPAMASKKAAQTLLLDVVRAGNRVVAVGQRGHIVYSDDEGKTWQQATVPVSTTLTAVQFPTPTKGWAVGHGGVILHSADAGQTWEKQFDGLVANNMVIAQNEKSVQELQAKLENASEAQLETLERQLEDAEIALEDSKFDAEVGASKPFLDVWFNNDKEGFAIGAYNFFFATFDGGKNWINYGNKLDNPDRLHLNGIAKVTGGAFFIVGEAGNIFLSTDGGKSWRKLDSPYDGSLFEVAGTGNVNEVLVMGLRGHLFRSENLGASWTEVKTGVENTLTGGVHDDNGHVAVVGNSGTVLTSKNFGQTVDAYIRSDRLSLAGVVILKNGQLLVVGEDGAKLTDSTGKNLP